MIITLRNEIKFAAKNWNVAMTIDWKLIVKPVRRAKWKADKGHSRHGCLLPNMVFKESRPEFLSGLSTDGPAFKPAFPVTC